MENENLENEDRKLTIEVEVQERSSCERHVKVTVSEEDVQFYVDREINEIQENQAIPGFRPGKAPRKVVAKRFRKEVRERAKNALLIDSLQQANDDQNMTPISEPDFKIDAIILPEEGPFVYEYDVEVRPTFDIPNWKGLKLERPSREFTPEDVDAAIKRIQASYGSLEPKGDDEAAELGDYIRTKLSFEVDGGVLRQAENETIRIRPTLSFHDCAIKGFDKLMVGAKAGDTRKTTVTLSDDAADESLRGKEIDAIFEIIEVDRAVLPEIDEEFLAKMGGFPTLGDFRDAVQETLQRQLEHAQQQTARRQISDVLTKDANWELPHALLRRQQFRELSRQIYELQRSGFSDDVIKKHMNYLRQNSMQATAQALKEHFIFEAIAESENIEATDTDFEFEIMLIASQTGETPRRVRSRIEKSGNWDVLRNQIIERKVVNMIMDEAEFVEKPYEIDALADESEEAVDRAVGASEEEIPEVTEEDAKEAAREAAEKNA